MHEYVVTAGMQILQETENVYCSKFCSQRLEILVLYLALSYIMHWLNTSILYESTNEQITSFPKFRFRDAKYFVLQKYSLNLAPLCYVQNSLCSLTH